MAELKAIPMDLHLRVVRLLYLARVLLPTTSPVFVALIQGNSAWGRWAEQQVRDLNRALSFHELDYFGPCPKAPCHFLVGLWSNRRLGRLACASAPQKPPRFEQGLVPARGESWPDVLFIWDLLVMSLMRSTFVSLVVRIFLRSMLWPPIESRMATFMWQGPLWLLTTAASA